MEVFHITPINDTMPHLEDGNKCQCGPVVDTAVFGVVYVIHNAWDQRELQEPDFHPRKN